MVEWFLLGLFLVLVSGPVIVRWQRRDERRRWRERKLELRRVGCKLGLRGRELERFVYDECQLERRRWNGREL